MPATDKTSNAFIKDAKRSPRGRKRRRNNTTVDMIAKRQHMRDGSKDAPMCKDED